MTEGTVGFCDACTIPCELKKLDVEGEYKQHLANSDVAAAVKGLYTAIGQLGSCPEGAPQVDEIYEGKVSLQCKHSMGDTSLGNFVLSQLSDALEEFNVGSNFSPMFTFESFENLSGPQKQLAAGIIAKEELAAGSHGIPEEALLHYLPGLSEA